MIVLDRHKLNRQSRRRFETKQSIPYVRLPVVLRPAQNSDIDEMTICGKDALPLDTCVSRHDQICLVLFKQVVNEMRWRRRFPQELVYFAWTAVTAQHLERP